jgi:hypothetical protein
MLPEGKSKEKKKISLVSLLPNHHPKYKFSTISALSANQSQIHTRKWSQVIFHH